MDRIYLDHNATMPIHPEVAVAIAECHRRQLANPSSQHFFGRQARRKLEDARDAVAELLDLRLSGQNADRIIFTSGGTEANNLALTGLSGPKPGRIVVSTIEHPCVIEPAKRLAQQGCDVAWLPVDSAGVAEIDLLDSLLEQPTQLVSLMLANHETGVLQPVATASEICQGRATLLHTDAAQAIGKIPVSFRDLQVDAMTIAAHKFGGPVGVGALAIRGEVDITPAMLGGFQQLGIRAGTESVAVAVGLHVALKLVIDDLSARAKRMHSLRNQLETTLLTELPDLVINGHGGPRLPNTSNIALPGVSRQTMFLALDAVGIACSTGSACASGASDPSPVLVAMGCDRSIIESSLRFSLSAETSPQEIDSAAHHICLIYKDLRRKKHVEKAASRPRETGEKTL
jgi:cysteine desulfurase